MTEKIMNLHRNGWADYIQEPQNVIITSMIQDSKIHKWHR